MWGQLYKIIQRLLDWLFPNVRFERKDKDLAQKILRRVVGVSIPAAFGSLLAIVGHFLWFAFRHIIT